MDYNARIHQVIAYIGEHLDETLSLDKLCSVACFSKYHFHRLFTAYTGLSLGQYVKWLRLKRAAHQLIAQTDKKIIDIGMDAGFDSHEAFSRAFKQACGMSPSDFRVKAQWHQWESKPYTLPKIGVKTMEVQIKQQPGRRLAVIEHRGDPKDMAQTLTKLITWSRAQAVDLAPGPGDAFGFGYDDPNLVAPEDFRFDLALTVPESLVIDHDEIFERYLPAGRYAVTTHRGSRDNIGDTIYPFYREWLPASGETLADMPCIFCYQNFDHDVAETELHTDLWMLLED